MRQIALCLFFCLCSSLTFAAPQNPTPKLIVYYGGWEGNEYDLKSLPANVTALNLSFANITPGYEVDTAASGYLTNIPAVNSQMWPSYINWTSYKFNHPDTKIFLSVGGATYNAIWNSTLNANSADLIAKSIAKVINQSYPVYKGNFADPNEQLGTVTIDGVDLDVETGSRLSTDVANNVILLTNDLKQYLTPGKLITFAGFSVGADPEDKCTVPGSDHCGEDIPLLTALNTTFDWVNVMAYDAGKDYAKSTYQAALANYAQYLGKNKTVLGLDVQSQWPGFQETAADLAAKALWQKQNNYAGAMFWGVGVSGDPVQEENYIQAIAAQLQNGGVSGKRG